MKIQLDTKALNALFPEGSEARVELQQAVIQNFMQKAYSHKLEQEISACVNNLEIATREDIYFMVAKQLGEKFELVYGNNSYKKELKAKRSEVQKFLDTFKSDTANAMINDFFEKISNGMEETIEKTLNSSEAEHNIRIKIRRAIYRIVNQDCQDIIEEVANKLLKTKLKSLL